MAENDQWSKWLLEARFGGDKQAAEAGMRQLHGIRDELLKNAAIKEGETLLDAGCGDGLVPFAALKRVGSGGHVIFSDVSRPLLEHCERLASAAGLVRLTIERWQTSRALPPADFVPVTLDLAAFGAGFLQAREVLAAELHGQALALFAAPLEHGRLLERRFGAQQAAQSWHQGLLGIKSIVKPHSRLCQGSGA